MKKECKDLIRKMIVAFDGTGFDPDPDKIAFILNALDKNEEYLRVLQFVQKELSLSEPLDYTKVQAIRGQIDQVLDPHPEGA